MDRSLFLGKSIPILNYIQFEKYFERSYDCHSAEGFGACNSNQYYNQWKCATAKAKLYVDLINLPVCLQDIINVHPVYYDYYAYCSAILLKTGVLGVLALTSLFVL
jgi:hypothetical protein